MNLGAQLLREWRLREGLNQTQAAARLDSHMSDVSMMENGNRKPTRERALKLREVTGILIDDWDAPPNTGAPEGAQAPDEGVA